MSSPHRRSRATQTASPDPSSGRLLRVATPHYDYVIVDTPPAFTEHVLAAFDVSDLLILIATLDIPAVKNLRLTLDTLDLLGNPKESRLVVLNRSDAKVGLRAEDVVAALKQDIAVMVPNSAAVPASINRGVPIILDEPTHPVSVALRELAERFVRVQAPAAGAQPAKAGRAASASERWCLAEEATDESRRPSRERPPPAAAGRGADAAAQPQRPPPSGIRIVDPFAAVKASVHQALLDSLGPQLYDPHLDQSELESRVRHTLQEVIDSEETPLSLADRTRIAQEVADEILGHGPLEPLLRDSEITEIMVNGADRIYVERAGKLYPVDTRFSSEAHLRRTIDKIVGRVGRRVDEASPLVDARLPDGSRVNAVIPPIALDGAMLTIRKFSTDPFTDKDLIAFGTFTPRVRDFLIGVRPGSAQHHHLRWYRLR